MCLPLVVRLARRPFILLNCAARSSAAVGISYAAMDSFSLGLKVLSRIDGYRASCPTSSKTIVRSTSHLKMGEKRSKAVASMGEMAT